MNYSCGLRPFKENRHVFPEGAAPGGPPWCRMVEGTALDSVRRGTVEPVTCGASRFFLRRRFLTVMWAQS